MTVSLEKGSGPLWSTSGEGVDPSTFTWLRGGGRWHGWMTAEVARSLPGMGRGLALIGGQIKQMPMDDYRGARPLPRPSLLEAPDPDQSRAWFVEVQVDDYLLNGNAVHYVTSRDANNWPATVSWIPAAWVTITIDPITREVSYWVGGNELDRENVVHVKRGADRWNPARGVGVVEQHLDALGTVRDQHRYEGEVLAGAAVPSVAIIAPDPRLSKTEAEEGKVEWMNTYGGPVREPAILPNGTQVIPLAWSPSDAQLNEARQLSLTDVANMLNLDGFHLGAPTGSHTYKSVGPIFLQLLRETIEPILAPFEDVWSAAWLPRGRRVRFDRRAVLVDDLTTTVGALRNAVDGGIMTVEEARAYMGLDPQLPASAAAPVTATSPVATVPDDSGAAQDEPDPEEVAS